MRGSFILGCGAGDAVRSELRVGFGAVGLGLWRCVTSRVGSLCGFGCEGVAYGGHEDCRG